MQTIKTIVVYYFGINFLLTGCYFLIKESNVMAAQFFIFAGILCTPFLLSKIEKHLSFKLNYQLKLILIIGSAILGVVSAEGTDVLFDEEEKKLFKIEEKSN